MAKTKFDEMHPVYFDNAATSRPKPTEVINAYVEYVNEIGASPGRGSYGLGVQASRMLFQSRKTIASFFGLLKRDHVVFTKNSTEAINLFFHGYLKKGDHVLISPYEHNAVLRPLHKLQEEGYITYSILPIDVILEPRELLGQYVRDNTRLVVSMLASNLTGRVIFSRPLAEAAHGLNLDVFVDASQGAGYIPVDMSNDHIDYLAFTGHKDMLGLPGVGGLCSKDEFHFSPLLQGGMGIHGEAFTNPDIFPDSYEAGTINMPAIWALKTAVEYVVQNRKPIIDKDNEIMSYLTERLLDEDSIIVYEPKAERVPTICFNVRGRDSSTIVSHLNKHGICSRGGIHCAILAHKEIGTEATGAVRISVNHYNTIAEVDYLLQVLREVR